MSFRLAKAITPHDTDLQFYEAIYVGGTGNLTVITLDGDTVTFTAVPVGEIIPVRTKVVRATATTATNLVGFVR